MRQSCKIPFAGVFCLVVTMPWAGCLDADRSSPTLSLPFFHTGDEFVFVGMGPIGYGSVYDTLSILSPYSESSERIPIVLGDGSELRMVIGESQPFPDQFGEWTDVYPIRYSVSRDGQESPFLMEYVSRENNLLVARALENLNAQYVEERVLAANLIFAGGRSAALDSVLFQGKSFDSGDSSIVLADPRQARQTTGVQRNSTWWYDASFKPDAAGRWEGTVISRWDAPSWDVDRAVARFEFDSKVPVIVRRVVEEPAEWMGELRLVRFTPGLGTELSPMVPTDNRVVFSSTWQDWDGAFVPGRLPSMSQPSAAMAQAERDEALRDYLRANRDARLLSWSWYVGSGSSNRVGDTETWDFVWGDGATAHCARVVVERPFQLLDGQYLFTVSSNGCEEFVGSSIDDPTLFPRRWRLEFGVLAEDTRRLCTPTSLRGIYLDLSSLPLWLGLYWPFLDEQGRETTGSGVGNYLGIDPVEGWLSSAQSPRGGHSPCPALFPAHG